MRGIFTCQFTVVFSEVLTYCFFELRNFAEDKLIDVFDINFPAIYVQGKSVLHNHVWY